MLYLLAMLIRTVYVKDHDNVEYPGFSFSKFKTIEVRGQIVLAALLVSHNCSVLSTTATQLVMSVIFSKMTVNPEKAGLVIAFMVRRAICHVLLSY